MSLFEQGGKRAAAPEFAQIAARRGERRGARVAAQRERELADAALRERGERRCEPVAFERGERVVPARPVLLDERRGQRV
ncbi:hypothetical protein DO72_5745 [Burkholderia pseudomallei]|nr:hypothetical protein DO72_5745 [Burkholderia pseudomallei]